MKRIIRGAEEYDAYTHARKFYVYLSRPGAIKKIKRRTHKRERREDQRWINEQLNGE